MMGVWVEDRRWKGIEFLFLSFYHRTYPINNFFLESISLSLTVTNTFSSVMMTWCILIIDFSNLWNILGWLNKLIFSKLKFIFFLTSLLRGKRGGEGEHGRRGCERERRRPEGDWPSARRWNHSNRNDYLCRLSGAVWSFSFFFFFPIAWYSTQQTPTLPPEPPPPALRATVATAWKIISCPDSFVLHFLLETLLFPPSSCVRDAPFFFLSFSFLHGDFKNVHYDYRTELVSRSPPPFVYFSEWFFFPHPPSLHFAFIGFIPRGVFLNFTEKFFIRGVGGGSAVAVRPSFLLARPSLTIKRPHHYHHHHHHYHHHQQQHQQQH